MNKLEIISNQNVLGNEFKIYGTKEEPLFLAKEVAEWINHSNPTEMLRSVDDDEKLNSIIFSAGQRRTVTFLTEDGMYEVLMQSRKPIAKQFKKQVKHILKELRTKGRYEVPTNPMQALELMFQAQKDTESKVEYLSEQVIDLRDNQKLDASEYGFISKQVQERVSTTIKKFNFANTSDVRGALLKDLNGSIKRITNISTRSQLKQKDFDKVREFILTWEPSSATQFQVRQLEVQS